MCYSSKKKKISSVSFIKFKDHEESYSWFYRYYYGSFNGIVCNTHLSGLQQVFTT